MTKYRNLTSQVSSSHLGPRLCFLVRNRTSFSSEDGSLFFWLASWFLFSSAGRTPEKRLLRARPTVEEKLSRFDWPLKTERARNPVQKDVLFLEFLRSVLRGPIMLTEIVYKLGTQRSP